MFISDDTLADRIARYAGDQPQVIVGTLRNIEQLTVEGTPALLAILSGSGRQIWVFAHGPAYDLVAHLFTQGQEVAFTALTREPRDTFVEVIQPLYRLKPGMPRPAAVAKTPERPARDLDLATLLGSRLAQDVLGDLAAQKRWFADHVDGLESPTGAGFYGTGAQGDDRLPAAIRTIRLEMLPAYALAQPGPGARPHLDLTLSRPLTLDALWTVCRLGLTFGNNIYDASPLLALSTYGILSSYRNDFPYPLSTYLDAAMGHYDELCTYEDLSAQDRMERAGLSFDAGTGRLTVVYTRAAMSPVRPSRARLAA